MPEIQQVQITVTPQEHETGLLNAAGFSLPEIGADGPYRVLPVILQLSEVERVIQQYREMCARGEYEVTVLDIRQAGSPS